MTAEQLFGRRVRTARKAVKLTLKKAAEKLEIHFNYLSKIERGEKRPSFELIILMAKVFAVSPMIFFMFEREETDDKILRKKISSLLDRYDAEQLAQIYRYIIFMVGP